MHCVIAGAAMALLLLAFTGVDGFVVAPRHGGSSTLTMQAHSSGDGGVQAMALAGAASAFVALGTTDAAVASIAASPDAPAVERGVFSASAPQQPPLSNFGVPQSVLADRAASALSTSSSALAAATATAPAPASTNVAVGAGVTIADIQFDGKVPKTEADEYVVITNQSKAPVDISKYYIYVATTGTQGPTFYFPKGAAPLKPGASVRVYTNEIHKETGGYSFESGKALWNNNGGLAVLKDANGKKITEFKYKPAK
eukprot:CAMPEP_0113548116 /NCGR_PEP_ID=MMETSP0015_2-20120614/12721_1 /TAXON_ID=2838 /ORGANISM="Odontella" /LENGTH=255 /DNA_ID=CAMNT_0000448723 /DNA_START=144 /DNA_END=911 /DNA_ORIENTATION=+ /assembly_acc=CAM_ASM_000160